MMLRAIRRKHIASIALFAVLFGALSPAFAALKYRGQPEVLAQICTTHGLASVAPDNQTSPGNPHADHQIHCAWCSPGATQPGIGGATVPFTATTTATQVLPALPATAPVFSAPAASYYPQAPPVLA